MKKLLLTICICLMMFAPTYAASKAIIMRTPMPKELVFIDDEYELIEPGIPNGGKMVYSLDGKEYTENIPVGKDAGKYNIYYKVKGDEKHRDSRVGVITAEIQKADPTIFEEPIGNELRYKDEFQKLIKEGRVIGGTFLYRLEATEFSEAIPQGKEVNTYKVYCMVKGDSNHNDLDLGILTAKIKGNGTPLCEILLDEDEITLEWNPIKGTEGYDVFFGECGKEPFEIVKTTKKTTFGTKNFKTNASYKGMVKAWVTRGGKKKYIAATPVVHTCVNGEDYTTPSEVTVNKKFVQLCQDKTYKLTASVAKKDDTKKMMSEEHAPTIRYMSSNPKIATVDKNGKITAQSVGACTVYAYAVNGIKDGATVTVLQG